MIFVKNYMSIIPSTDYGHPMKAQIKDNLKNWADVADKICCRHTEKFGSGSEFSAVQRRLFPLWVSVVPVYDNFPIMSRILFIMFKLQTKTLPS